jgi:large subunit ribosomal protein L4
MPRRMRRAALRSALSVKAESGDVIVLDQVNLNTPRTKEMMALVDKVARGNSALLLLADRNENVEKSAQNMVDVKTLRAGYLNIRDLLGYDNILMPLAALDIVNGFLAGEDTVASISQAEEE